MNCIRGKLLKSQMPRFLINTTRSESEKLWNKDWMPGPYPTTPEERAAAAAKYNLLPEEYEPDPDGFGDYPKLPDISGATKASMNPYYNWDMPALKKDYGETMHVKHNYISEDRWDINHFEKQQVHPFKQTLAYFGSIGGLFFLCWILNDMRVAYPHMKKQFPADGKHYKYPTS